MDDKPLNEILFEEPFRFEFFQAVRLLGKIFSGQSPVGREAMPHEEIIRFRSNVTLNFPASEIQELNEHADGDGDPADRRTEMLVNFMGIIGASGVLPVHYTELALERIRHRDTALWAFLDIFNHRSISMFFRAWEKYRFPIGYEKGQDDFTGYLFDFAGLGTAGLLGRMSIDDETLLPYVGLVSQMPHSTNALENIVSDYFRADVKIVQFFGQWLALNEEDVTKLGSRNTRLGQETIAGTRIWDQQSKFRVKIGPLPFKQFQAFLPNGSANKPLRSILKFVSGMEFDFDVQLVLNSKQVPSTVLTTRAMRRPMLGWTSWLKTKPFKSHDEQVVLSMEE